MNRRAALFAFTSLALGGCTQLSAFNTFTPKDPSARLMRGIAYGDNPRQALDVYAPPGPKQSGDMPVIVFFYGGGWYEGRRQDYAFAGRALASLGFVVVIPDYRLYPEVTYPAFMEDAALAVRWVQDHIHMTGATPRRILLAGHSAGAYIAVQLALNSRFLRGAGVDLANIKGAAGLAGPYDFLPLDVPESRHAFGAYPDLPETQPINHARADAPLIFLAHGDKDETVRLSNTQNLQAALLRVGAPVEVKIYPRVDHAGLVLALSRPFRGKAPLLADLTAFFRRVVS